MRAAGAEVSRICSASACGQLLLSSIGERGHQPIKRDLEKRPGTQGARGMSIIISASAHLLGPDWSSQPVTCSGAQEMDGTGRRVQAKLASGESFQKAGDPDALESGEDPPAPPFWRLLHERDSELH